MHKLRVFTGRVKTIHIWGEHCAEPDIYPHPMRAGEQVVVRPDFLNGYKVHGKYVPGSMTFEVGFPASDVRCVEYTPEYSEHMLEKMRKKGVLK